MRLLPDPAQAAALLATLERANAACDFISAVAWRERTFGKFALQKVCYADLKARFGLSAQMAIRALAKVGDAYKRDQRTARRFRPHGSIAYDDRILAYRPARQTVSIWTLAGRQTIPFVAHALSLLAYRQGESDLVYRDGKWFLLATCDIPTPTSAQMDTYLCVSCGLGGLPDHFAAVIIGRRASVNAPHVPDAGTLPAAPGASPRL